MCVSVSGVIQGLVLELVLLCLSLVWYNSKVR